MNELLLLFSFHLFLFSCLVLTARVNRRKPDDEPQAQKDDAAVGWTRLDGPPRVGHSRVLRRLLGLAFTAALRQGTDLRAKALAHPVHHRVEVARHEIGSRPLQSQEMTRILEDDHFIVGMA